MQSWIRAIRRPFMLPSGMTASIKQSMVVLSLILQTEVGNLDGPLGVWLWYGEEFQQEAQRNGLHWPSAIMEQVVRIFSLPNSEQIQVTFIKPQTAEHPGPGLQDLSNR